MSTVSVDTEGKTSSMSYNILAPTKVDLIISFAKCSVLHPSFKDVVAEILIFSMWLGFGRWLILLQIQCKFLPFGFSFSNRFKVSISFVQH